MGQEVKDHLGTTTALMPLGSVSKVPDIVFEKESGQREWKIMGIVPDTIFVGGHNNAVA